MAELNNTVTIPDTYLVYFKNYFIYADMIRNRQTNIKIYVPKDITADNINDHIDAIHAILKDGIDEEYVHNITITVSWGKDIECELFIVNYWFNLFMWNMILKNGESILPKHIFWNPTLKRSDIKNFVDTYVLTRAQKISKGNEFLNNNLCDGLWNFSKIEDFSWYLANTINNEDNIELMDLIPEFYNITHADLSAVPFDQVKDVGLKMTDQAIEYIRNSEQYLGYEHGLTNNFRAGEAVSPRQFKEVFINIGSKSNGSGTAYPHIITRSYMTGGVKDLLSLFVESNSARSAQTLSKVNVGDSGDFARRLGLNNTDTILNYDNKYECRSKNFIKFEIKTKKHLSMIKNRYYRFDPNGMQYLIDDKDESLIGKTIYMRSPMTCASHANGTGICKCCYGDLYYTNININVGKMAAELLSSQLTQKLLSAKHLLETAIVTIKWNPEFLDFFDVDINTIKLTDLSDLDLRHTYMLIDPDNVYTTSEEEDAISMVDEDGNEIVTDVEDTGSYDEYITYFYIKMPDGSIIKFGSEDQDSLFISQELNQAIRKKAVPEDGQVVIPLSAIQDDNLFYIKINNNEISKTMNDIINMIDKASVTEVMTKDEILQSIVDLVVNGNLTIDAVHLEVILSNQIVDPKNILDKPNWNIPNVPYRMFTLDHALTNNPSVIVSLLYKDLHKVLYNPLTFTKHAPSFFDLFFAVQPQNYMDDGLLTDEVDIQDPDKGIEMVRLVDRKERSK